MKNVHKKIAVAMAACLSFGLVALGGCGAEKIPAEEVTVYMPDGAPALALAELMAKDTEDDGVTYRVVDASMIASKVSGQVEEENADFCVLPLNAASNILGDGEKYQLLGLVTQGNMYLISQSETQIDDLSDLIGETVGVMQLANVPGLTLKAALNRQDVPWRTLTDGVAASAEEVNLKAATGIDGKYEYYLAAEPLVSKTLANAQAGFHVVGDLQALYNGADSTQVGYPQAALVAKRSIIEERGDWTKDFVADVAAAADWLQTATADGIYNAVTSHFEDGEHKATFSAATLGKDTIARCGIKFAYAKNCRDRIDSFLTELVEIDAQKASLVNEKFYWLG